MRKYQPPTREFFRLPNKIFQVPLDATQFKLYAYLVCCSGSKGYCWPTMGTPASKSLRSRKPSRF